MATRTSAGGACSGNLRAIQSLCRATRRDRVLRALFCILLGFCAGCTTSAEQAKAMPGAGVAPLPPRRPVPVTAQTLLVKPVDRGRLTSSYGTRHNPFSKRRQVHQGIDWAAPRGTPVRAASDGVVVAAGRLGSYGRYLRIDHGRSIETAYAHLDRYAPKLRPGRIVRQGDEVGRVGSSGRATGPHLHYEVLVAGRQIDPLAVATVTAAPAPDPADAALAGADIEFGIGGPDIAVEEEAADAGSRDDAAPPLEAIDGSAVIWIDDLLHQKR
jgi:hypothetical protein